MTNEADIAPAFEALKSGADPQQVAAGLGAAGAGKRKACRRLLLLGYPVVVILLGWYVPGIASG